MTSAPFRRAWLAHPSAWLVFAFVAVLGSGCVGVTRDDTAAVDRLLGLIEERLAVAPEVARTKWNTGAAIDDPPREARVIDAAVEAAAEYGLAPGPVSDFFRGQIEANKTVQ